MLLYLWTGNIIVFIIGIEPIELTLLVTFIPILIIDPEDNPCPLLPFPKLCNLVDGARVPSSIMILAIHQIPFFQSYPPIKIARPRLIRGNHIAASIDYRAVLQDIIQIFNF